jgi:hypothetical protein
MRTECRGVLLLLIMLAAVGCETTTVLAPSETEDSKNVHIVVLDPIAYVGDPISITSRKGVSITDELLYYWLLGDDSSFSVNQDTFVHIYKDPGSYTITLTARKKSDFSVVDQDTAVVQIFDSTLRSSASLHKFTQVDCKIRVQCKNVMHDSRGSPKDTTYI